MHSVHGLKVRVILLVLDHVVVLVLEDLGAMGELTLNHNEKKHSHGEEINAAAIVLVVSEDFRGHVAR